MTLMTKQLSKLDGKRTDWVTPNSVPDPSPLPRVHGWNLLIRPIEPAKEIEVAGGFKIYTPDSYQEDQRVLNNVGRVVAMGPLCYTDPEAKKNGDPNPHGKYKDRWVEVGDLVVWGKHQGVKIEFKGVTFVLLADDLVLLSPEDPSDINPQINFKKGNK
jgi:co-chaperonin GroES (HSP10)